MKCFKILIKYCEIVHFLIFNLGSFCDAMLVAFVQTEPAVGSAAKAGETRIGDIAKPIIVFMSFLLFELLLPIVYFIIFLNFRSCGLNIQYAILI